MAPSTRSALAPREYAEAGRCLKLAARGNGRVLRARPSRCIRQRRPHSAPLSSFAFPLFFREYPRLCIFIFYSRAAPTWWRRTRALLPNLPTLSPLSPRRRARRRRSNTCFARCSKKTVRSRGCRRVARRSKMERARDCGRGARRNARGESRAGGRKGGPLTLAEGFREFRIPSVLAAAAAAAAVRRVNSFLCARMTNK